MRPRGHNRVQSAVCLANSCSSSCERFANQNCELLTRDVPPTKPTVRPNVWPGRSDVRAAQFGRRLQTALCGITLRTTSALLTLAAKSGPVRQYFISVPRSICRGCTQMLQPKTAVATTPTPTTSWPSLSRPHRSGSGCSRGPVQPLARTAEVRCTLRSQPVNGVVGRARLLERRH